ncbi:hypothetical protein F2Q69_00023458 [Brassica cretica]|uniref:Uncharacterized protein n=1 Tax=Brassica cretica TaxID=69181 RepID=A0A8S9QDG4_BRACR|nr:hypothetical protein F2Q69_00023458 [Brassica cretica]
MGWMNNTTSFYEYKIRKIWGQTVVAEKEALRSKDVVKVEHAENEQLSAWITALETKLKHLEALNCLYVFLSEFK